MAPLFILFGSATGNAEHIAKDLADKFKPTSIFDSVTCAELDQFKKKCLPTWEASPPADGPCRKYGVIIVTSTTGNGDAPENAGRFVRYIKRNTTASAMPFKNCAYAVLGLGDTNYDQFCAVGKTIDKKISELGGTRAKPLGTADEATGLEDVVEPWVDTVFADVEKACAPVPDNGPSGEEQSDGKESKENETKPEGDRAAPAKGVANGSSTSDAPLTSPNANKSRNHVELESVTTPAAEAEPAIACSSSPLCILYGSATGNSEHIAKDLAEKYNAQLKSSPSTCFFKEVLCAELNQYKKKCQKYWDEEPILGTKHGIIIVTATTGNADPPENADRFFRYIKRKTTVSAMPFKYCAFAVLGLGDTNYDQFCAVGKLVDTKLAELGGTRAKATGCADEATGLEDVVEPWAETVLQDMTHACRGSKGAASAVKECSGGDKPEAPKSVVSAVGAPFVEEKKTDVETSSAPSYLLKEGEVSKNSGVSIIRRLLSLSPTDAIPPVPHAALPSLGPSLSSCELIQHTEDESRDRAMSLSEMERMTVSTGSTSAIHYTINHPYESSILDARYLTNTDDKGAIAAAEILASVVGDEDDKMIRAMQCYEEHFPLSSGAEEANKSDDEKARFERNGKRVIEMRLSLPDDYTLEYQPGDSIGLIVPNSPEATKFVLKMLKENHNIEPTQKVSLDEKHPITVADAIRHHIDLCSPIKNKRTLFFLSQLATNPEEERVLRLLSSKTPTGEEIFDRYIDEQRISVVDVLREFPSCQHVALEGLLGALPGIPPRYYSVTSSPLSKQKELALTVAFSVVDYLTPSLPGSAYSRRRIGGLATRHLECLCSPFLCKSLPHSLPSVKVFAKPTSEFHLPLNLSTPLILIGPGTGVAPFMGFLAHRQGQINAHESAHAAKVSVEGTWRGGYDLQENEVPVTRRDGSGLVLGLDYKSKQNIGEIDLFFGCRYKDHDWLYRDEMKQFKDDGILTSLNTAFSREASERAYVQDIMKRNETANRIVSMIWEKHCSVYVCGDGNAMARDVQDAIIDLVGSSKFASGTEDGKYKAKAYLEQMKADKRFVMDIWS